MDSLRCPDSLGIDAHHGEHRLARRVGPANCVPRDYFPEVREDAVINAIRANSRLRDDIYFKKVRPRPRRPSPSSS
jgi:hypothetical protein